MRKAFPTQEELQLFPEMFYDPRDAHQLDGVVNRAVQLINPVEKKTRACGEWVKDGIFLVRYRARSHAPQGGPRLEKLLVALEKALTAYDRFVNTPGFTRVLFKHFDLPSQNAFPKIPKVIEAVLNGRRRHIPKKGPVPDGAKRVAALFSLISIEHFTKKPVTKTIGGPFYELASVLYEGGTYVMHANLERHCRAVFEDYTRIDLENLEDPREIDFAFGMR